ADYYAVAATAGDALQFTTSTPADGAGAFLNQFDPALELYDAAGNLLAANDNGAADGRTAVLNYTTLAAWNCSVRSAAPAANAAPLTAFSAQVNYQLNAAPTLAGSPVLALATIDQNDAANAGTLITALLATGPGGSPIVDTDVGDPQGIAITGASTSGGSWQF